MIAGWRPQHKLLERIQSLVAGHYGLTVEEMVSPSRRSEVVLPRQIAIWLAREQTSLSLPALARAFGKADHTTALYAVRKITAMAAADRSLASYLYGLQAEVAS